MTTRRAALLGAAAGFVAGCGGGGVPSAPAAVCESTKLVSGWGDSLMSGAGLRPRPMARILHQLGGLALVIDRSIPGSAPPQEDDWSSAIEIDPAQVQILRFGGAASVVGLAPSAIARDVERLATISMRLGKRVVVAGVTRVVYRPEWHVPMGWSPEWVEQLDARADAANVELAAAAVRLGVPFVDLRAVRFDGAADLADGAHPAQAYSDRCADAIAAAVRPLLTT